MARHRVKLGLLTCLLGVAACDQQDPLVSLDPAPARTGPDGRAWESVGGPVDLAVTDPAGDAEMAAAIEQARSTADDARGRWRADTEARNRWAVKWAAPTVLDGVEHVWVRPRMWSKFRLEGVLLSPPQAELLCGREAGELVSFPAEELSDWVRLVDGTPSGQREGGLTIQLLERRYGRPPGEDR